LDTAQLKDIVTRMATKLQLSSDMPVADILLLGLQDAFPCEAKVVMRLSRANQQVAR
jgi:hypothetical protein